MKNFILVFIMLTEIISTGGTIDSYFNQKKDRIIPLPQSIIPSYFRDTVRITPKTLFHELIMKDSRDFDFEKDLINLIAHIRSSVASRFIVTIGTFAMPDVALHLYSAFDWKSLNKQVIFTGAMSPMYRMIGSDAGFNLGYAFSKQQKEIEKFPVLLAMNAELSPAGSVAKDLRTGNFRPINIKHKIEKNLRDAIHIISTGGSIDIRYDALDGVILKKKSSIEEYIRSLELHKKISFTQIETLKHSFELNNEDYKDIKEQVINSPHKKIIITAGIYSLEKLQNYLQKNIEEFSQKIIILTGSRYSLLHDDITDASFNLGFAIGKLSFVKAGVHIALCGDIINPEKTMETMYTKDELIKIKTQHPESFS